MDWPPCVAEAAARPLVGCGVRTTSSAVVTVHGSATWPDGTSGFDETSTLMSRSWGSLESASQAGHTGPDRA